MKNSPEANPEHKIIIKIVDGLIAAEGACAQLIHHHGDGNLNFHNMAVEIEAIRKAISATATIPLFRHIKPWDPTGPVVYNLEQPQAQETKEGTDDQPVLAEGKDLCAGGAGADAIDKSPVEPGAGAVGADGSAVADGDTNTREGNAH